ncbi:MAG: PilZ domain-containing protein, partial [Pyrinomonadaceae bacterium]
MPREEERVHYYTEILLESGAGIRGARISDVSAGGCYIDTISPPPEGENVSFEFKNPAGARLKFNGTVAYV